MMFLIVTHPNWDKNVLVHVHRGWMDEWDVSVRLLDPAAQKYQYVHCIGQHLQESFHPIQNMVTSLPLMEVTLDALMWDMQIVNRYTMPYWIVPLMIFRN